MIMETARKFKINQSNMEIELEIIDWLINLGNEIECYKIDWLINQIFVWKLD